MCLGVPAKVIKIYDNGEGQVEYKGVKVKVNLMLLDDVKIGDWVIVHAGFAISKMHPEDAEQTLKIIESFENEEKI